MNPLNSVKGAITTGVILAVAIIVALHGGAFNELGLARWLHIVAGITWIGLLYYFNLVQIPGLAAANADKGGPGGAGINKYIAPRALLWFRWGAVVTWLTGAWYLARFGKFASAFTLGSFGEDRYGLVIGIGAWLGTIMLFNVWVLIWPNQKKILESCRPRMNRRLPRARLRCWPRARTSCFRSRCCCAWVRRCTDCRSEITACGRHVAARYPGAGCAGTG